MQLPQARPSDVLPAFGSEEERRVRTFFGNKAGATSGVWYPTHYSWQLAELLSFIHVTDRAVLDVGCGAGNLALLAAARGGRVFASDFIPEAVAATAQNAKALNLRVETQTSDSTRVWEKEDLKFDLVVCNPPCVDILADLDRPDLDPLSNSYLAVDLLRSYRRVLKPNGCLISAVSGRSNMDWVEDVLGADTGTEPFVIGKRPPVEGVEAAKIGGLVKTGLIVEDAGQYYWDAYYFCVFHF